MPKSTTKKKKKLSYEQRSRLMKKRRKNLSEEEKQKIKEYNRARSLRARENETPMAREIRLERGRELSRRRRLKRKAQAQREKKQAALLAAKNPPPKPPPAPVAKSPPAASRAPPTANRPSPAANRPTPAASRAPPAPPNRRMPRLINISQMRKQPNNNFASGVMQYNANMKSLGRLVDGGKPSEMNLPYMNYKAPFPQKMRMPSTNSNINYDDMATVCPIECNVECNISSEPPRRFNQPSNSINRSKPSGGNMIVKNLGSHVVMKKKVVNQAPPESMRLQNGSPSDWNGFASVCPIECNVDITDPGESAHQRASSENSTVKRNSLLDSLKQMGTHVFIKKKSDVSDKNANLRPSSYKTSISRALPVECNVDITPIDSRLRNSEITIMKHNGSSSIKRLGSQILVQKVKKPVSIIPKGYESPEDNHEDFDMTCPIECNVFISESS